MDTKQLFTLQLTVAKTIPKNLQHGKLDIPNYVLLQTFILMALLLHYQRALPQVGSKHKLDTIFSGKANSSVRAKFQVLHFKEHRVQYRLNILVKETTLALMS